MKSRFLLFAFCALSVVAAAKRPHKPPMPPCAPSEQMQLVIQTLKSQSFDEKKLEVAQLCVTIGHFCTDDMARMAAEFSFDDSRLAFLQYAYPYCTDRERYPMLKDCFTFQSNFETLMDYIYK